METPLNKTELKTLVEGAQEFLAPEDDPRDSELFDPSKPETTEKDIAEPRPVRHY